MRSKIRSDRGSCKVLEFWRHLNKSLVQLPYLIQLTCAGKDFEAVLDRYLKESCIYIPNDLAAGIPIYIYFPYVYTVYGILRGKFLCRSHLAGQVNPWSDQIQHCFVESESACFPVLARSEKDRSSWWPTQPTCSSFYLPKAAGTGRRQAVKANALHMTSLLWLTGWNMCIEQKLAHACVQKCSCLLIFYTLDGPSS